MSDERDRLTINGQVRQPVPKPIDTDRLRVDGVSGHYTLTLPSPRGPGDDRVVRLWAQSPEQS